MTDNQHALWCRVVEAHNDEDCKPMQRARWAIPSTRRVNKWSRTHLYLPGQDVALCGVVIPLAWVGRDGTSANQYTNQDVCLRCERKALAYRPLVAR